MLTLDDAVEKALAGNRTFRQEQISRETRERAKKNLWNIFLPEITASAGIGHDNEIFKNSPDAPWNGKVGGALSLSLGSDIPYKMSRIKNEYEAGNIDYDNARNNLEMAVMLAFYELLIYERDIELLESSIDANKKRYDQAVVNHRAGLVPELDVLNARLAWNRMLPDYDSVTTEYQRKMDQFKIALGMDPDEDIVLSGDVEAFVPADIDLNSLPDDFETPELRRLRQELAIAESSQKELSGASLFPELTFGWNMTPTWDDLKDNDPHDRGSFNASLAWHLDNLIPNSQGNLRIRQLKDNADILRLQVEEEEADSISTVENLVRKITRQQSTVKTLEMTADIAEESLRLTEDAYRYGVKDILDVSEAQQNLHEAQLDILKEKYDVLCSLLELEYKLNLPFGTLGGE